MAQNAHHHHKLPPHAQRYLVTGILTVIPIWITWLLFEVVLAQLTRAGMPGVRALSRMLHEDLSGLSNLLLQPWFQSAGGADHPDRPVPAGLGGNAGGGPANHRAV